MKRISSCVLIQSGHSHAVKKTCIDARIYISALKLAEVIRYRSHARKIIKFAIKQVEYENQQV